MFCIILVVYFVTCNIADATSVVLFPGHGGDGFLKFQDAEEITSVELADAFEQMWQKRR